MSSDDTANSGTVPTTNTMIDVAANLKDVRDRMKATCQRCGLDDADDHYNKIRLVAVSKTKPISLLEQAYDAGQRVFGENYVQELIDKVPQLPVDVTWHFIGPLQSNKVNKVVQAFLVPGFHRLVIETVSSEKLANKLNQAVASAASEEGASTGGDHTQMQQQLQVMVQVNTSGEESKSGIEPNQVVSLCRHIVQNCPQLKLIGLMTIGAEGDASCFDALIQCRNQVATELYGGELTSSSSSSTSSSSPMLEVSMGMSGDFELAIEKGATSIRVGSTIFGERDYSK